MNVVVVDDEDDIRLLATAMLWGHQVQGANSVEAARQLDWTGVDVALIDVMMPQEAGSVLLRWLNENHPTVKRVICTALNVEGLGQSYELAHDAITKPFSTDLLERALGV